MKNHLTRENAMGAAILVLLFAAVFVLPVLAGGAPPAWTGAGFAAFAAAYLTGISRQRKGADAMGVTLEALSADHLLEVKTLWRDPDAVRYTDIPDLCSPSEVTARLDRLLACQAELPGPTVFAILRGGRFCGIAGCLPMDEKRESFSLFCQLLPGVWGQGTGRAAAKLALDALYRLFPAAAVYAGVVAENTAGVRILEQLGFARTAVHPGAFRRDGRMLDIWDYLRSPA